MLVILKKKVLYRYNNFIAFFLIRTILHVYAVKYFA